MNIRALIRKSAIWILGSLFVAVGGEFVIELLKERGFFESPSARVGTLIDALTTLVDSWWFALAFGFFAGLAAALWLVRLVPERRPSTEGAEELTEEDLARGLYTGHMQIDSPKLTTEFYIEVAVRCFNATGASLRVAETSGAVAYGLVTGGNIRPEDKGALPPPQVLRERTAVDNIPSNSEFMVVLGQRVPRIIAEAMGKLIDEGKQIHFRFDDLNVLMSPVGSSNPQVRLPLWNGVNLRKIEDHLFSGRIISARVGPVELKVRATL